MEMKAMVVQEHPGGRAAIRTPMDRKESKCESSPFSDPRRTAKH
jgi:hypothetical protein